MLDRAAQTGQIRPICPNNVIYVIHLIPGDDTSRVGPDLGSTRSRGKDDGSSHDVVEFFIIFCYFYKFLHVKQFQSRNLARNPWKKSDLAVGDAHGSL